LFHWSIPIALHDTKKKINRAAGLFCLSLVFRGPAFPVSPERKAIRFA
jgi:hypothetical protein